MEKQVYPYENYKTTNGLQKLFVSAEYDKYRNDFKDMNGVRHTTLRCGSGWLFPIESEERLQGFFNRVDSKISNINQKIQLNELEKNIKSHKKQHKYHRSTSDTEDDDVGKHYRKFSKSPKYSTPLDSSSSDEDKDEKITKKQLKQQIEALQKQLEKLKNVEKTN